MYGRNNFCQQERRKNRAQWSSKVYGFIFEFSFISAHRGVICHFLFRRIYYCHNSKSTGKKTGKTHLCAVVDTWLWHSAVVITHHTVQPVVKQWSSHKGHHTLVTSHICVFAFLTLNRGFLRKWSKMQPGEIKFQNKSGGMWDPYPNLVHHPNIGPQHPPTLATPTGLPLIYCRHNSQKMIHPQ